MNEQFLWVEKYRPKTIDECILSDTLKSTLMQYVHEGQIPNFLFHGSAGVGKTTVAKAICNQIGAEYLFINGSDESGIDVLRTKIKSFASTISLTNAKKIVILDEADYLNPNTTQPALRAFIEEFANNCRFIFTCNYKNRIIEPLHSRTAVIDFTYPSDQKNLIAGLFYKRVIKILKQENIEFDQKVVAELIKQYFPDYRRIINELQRYSISGKIDTGIFVNLSNESYKQLFQLLKSKKFNDVRKWVGENSDKDTTKIFSQLYSYSDQFVDQSSVPSLIIILADYQYKDSFVIDHELNLMACLTEIMSGCKFQ
jgi:DNA polymerase III delta prime subunit